MIGPSIYENLGLECPHCKHDWGSDSSLTLPEIMRPVLNDQLVEALRADGEHELADIAEIYLRKANDR